MKSGEGFGAGFTQESRFEDGKRADAFSAFVEPLLKDEKHRKKLRVVSLAKVQQIVINDKKEAEAVKVRVDGKTVFLKPNKEVILCAGAINSPQILMLSGVGEKTHLESLGIKVVHPNPNVGSNLHDHPCIIHAYELKDECLEDVALQSGGFPGVAFFQSNWANKNTPCNGPDIQFHISGNVPSLFQVVAGQDALLPLLEALLGKGRLPQFGTKVHFLFYNLKSLLFSLFRSIPFISTTTKKLALYGAVLNQPLSRGTLHLASNDIQVPPIINPVKKIWENFHFRENSDFFLKEFVRKPS